jgi:MFS family permease
MVAIFALLFSGLIVLFGPLTLRYDLRRDLEMLDVLKSTPLPGRAVVGAEVLGPALVLSGVAILGWAAAFVASLASASNLPVTSDRLALLFAASVGTLPVVTALLLMQNAAALLYPAWSAIGPERATGFEATGQRILSFVGTALGLLVAVLPAAIVGAVAAVAVRGLGASPAWVVTAWTAVGAPVLAAECWLGVRLLGPVLEGLEPSGIR